MGITNSAHFKDPAFISQGFNKIIEKFQLHQSSHTHVLSVNLLAAIKKAIGYCPNTYAEGKGISNSTKLPSEIVYIDKIFTTTRFGISWPQRKGWKLFPASKG